jgi:hypothetical protein
MSKKNLQKEEKTGQVIFYAEKTDGWMLFGIDSNIAIFRETSKGKSQGNRV